MSIKLKAVGDDDLAVMATILHDARMPMKEVAFLEEENRFAVLLDRCDRRNANRSSQPQEYPRVRCALIVDHVVEAKAHDFEDLSSANASELMTILSRTGSSGSVAITLLFKCGGYIRLKSDRIDARLADIEEAVEGDL